MRLWDLTAGPRWADAWRAAIEAHSRLAIDATDAAAWRALGEWFAFRRADTLAIECFSRAQTFGDDVPAFVRAVSHLRAKQFAAARDALLEAQSKAATAADGATIDRLLAALAHRRD